MSKRRKKRDVFSDPGDPKFIEQWYLVSISTQTAFDKKLHVFCLSDMIQNRELVELFVSQSQ